MIKKRGATWWLDIWVGKRRVRRSLHTTERVVAIERARDITLELRKPRPAGTDIAAFSERYLEWAKQNHPSSCRTDKYRVPIIKAWFIKEGVTVLEQVTPYHVEQFRAHLLTKTFGHTTKIMGRSSTNRYLALIRSMFNRARDWEMFTGANPVSRVKFYKETAKAQPLSPAEVAAVLDAARVIQADPRSPIQRIIHDFLTLLFNTGLRRSEALGLRWRDYNGAEIVVVGKGDKRRVVPLNEAARAVVDRQPHDGIYILPVENRVTSDNLRRTVLRLRKLSGVAHFHLHLCRHYAMTSMLAAGVDIQTAAEILGHSRFSVALIYAHSSPERKRQAVEAIHLDPVTGHRPAD